MHTLMNKKNILLILVLAPAIWLSASTAGFQTLPAPQLKQSLIENGNHQSLLDTGTEYYSRDRELAQELAALKKDIQDKRNNETCRSKLEKMSWECRTLRVENSAAAIAWYEQNKAHIAPAVGSYFYQTMDESLTYYVRAARVMLNSAKSQQPDGVPFYQHYYDFNWGWRESFRRQANVNKLLYATAATNA
jgi:hypothetical protein